MYIGKVAALTGCTPKAIRLYEQLGLLSAPAREGKYRVYTEHHLTIVRLIRAAQASGFELAEMAPLIEEKNRRQQFPLDVAHQGIAAKRAQIQAEIAALRTLDARLVLLQSELDQLFAEPAADCAL